LRLKKSQKEAVVAWIAEGLETTEINERAGNFNPPFSVLREQVYKYRKSRAIDLAAIQKAGEFDALTQGLALKEVRVQKLQQLAALLEADLFGGFLWTEQTKSVGSGLTQEIVDYEEFNASEVSQYRGVLDDIAKEMGGRIQKQELTGKDGSDLFKAYIGINPDKV
jgi:hypothetical protein